MLDLQLYISQEDGLLCIEDLIPRMPVQWLLKTLLIQCMSNQPNGTSQDKEAIQVANLDDVCDLRLHSPRLKIPDCIRNANSRLLIVRMRVQPWQPKGNVKPLQGFHKHYCTYEAVKSPTGNPTLCATWMNCQLQTSRALCSVKHHAGRGGA